MLRRFKFSPFIFLTLLFIPYTYIISQEGWFSINQQAEGNDMKSVYFVNDSTGYLVSNEGNLFTTYNRGESWSHIKLSDNSLNDIFFVKNTGFIVGDNGIIFKCEDGINWIEKNSGTNNKLNAVYFIDKDTGYVFGSLSTILKTIDAGENWQKIKGYYDLDITDGAFGTPAFGMCVTSEGFLLRTLDYGNNWGYYKPGGDEFYSICFTDSDTVYIPGWGDDVSFVFKFTGRGENRDVLWPETLSRLKSCYFFNSDSGYIAGENGFISKTTDGGITWALQNNQIFKTLNSVFFLNFSNGFAVGEDSTMHKTMDGGLHWDPIGSGHTQQLLGINFPTNEIGYAVGQDGYIFKTTNSGATWFTSRSYSDGYLYFVYFLNTDTGFAGGYSGKLIKTTNGGLTWETEDYSNQGIGLMFSINFIDEKIGVVCAGNRLLKTTDGGMKWEIIKSNTSSTDLAFLDSNNWISAGDSLFLSTDGGSTWIKKDSNGYFLHSVAKINSQTACAVGWMGIILITRDGGNSWKTIPSGTVESLEDVKFVTERIGYIAGSGGTILYTNDAGESWSPQNSGSNEDLNTICFTNIRTGYIAGNSGTILKTINGGVVKVEVDKTNIPAKFSLYQNYPNPFNSQTKIKFEIPVSSNVKISIYDILGKEVKVLVNEYLNNGTYETQFDASDLSSGVYLYRLAVQGFIETKKLIILR